MPLSDVRLKGVKCHRKLGFSTLGAADIGGGGGGELVISDSNTAVSRW